MTNDFNHSTNSAISMYLRFQVARNEKQVVQLWQRDRAKLATFLINVELCSVNHKTAFLNHYAVSGAT